MGALFFDPQGADFTLWINRFKDEVYRNWNIPEAANLGAARGHVDFEFVVERDGTMSSLRMLKSSGTNSLDRAAEFALRGSRLLPLPDDYGPARVTMQVSFHYNDYPQRLLRTALRAPGRPRLGCDVRGGLDRGGELPHDARRAARGAAAEAGPVTIDSSSFVAAPSLRVGVRVSVRESALRAASGVRVHGAAATEGVWLLRELPRATFDPIGESNRLRLRETGDVLVRAIVEPPDRSQFLSEDAAPTAASSRCCRPMTPASRW